MSILESISGDFGEAFELFASLLIQAVDALVRLLQGIAQLPVLLLDFIDLLGPDAAGLGTVVLVALGAMVFSFILNLF